MKKIGLFLLAVVMVVGAVGMVGCSKDDKLEIADMAGTYIFAKLTVTPTGGSPTTYSPPTISGSMTLTSSGTSSGTFTLPGIFSTTLSGTFTVDDPTIVFHEGTDTTNGVISNDGKTITSTSTQDGQTVVLEFTKS